MPKQNIMSMFTTISLHLFPLLSVFIAIFCYFTSAQAYEGSVKLSGCPEYGYISISTPTIEKLKEEICEEYLMYSSGNFLLSVNKKDSESAFIYYHDKDNDITLKGKSYPFIDLVNVVDEQKCQTRTVIYFDADDVHALNTIVGLMTDSCVKIVRKSEDAR